MKKGIISLCIYFALYTEARNDPRSLLCMNEIIELPNNSVFLNVDLLLTCMRLHIAPLAGITNRVLGVQLAKNSEIILQVGEGSTKPAASKGRVQISMVDKFKAGADSRLAHKLFRCMGGILSPVDGNGSTIADTIINMPRSLGISVCIWS